MPQMPGYQVLSSAPALPPLLLLLLAVVIGVLVRPRAWLAAASAYLIGVAVWVVVWLRPSPPWAPSDNWFLEAWVQFLLTNVLLPTLIFAAAAGIARFLATAVRRRTSRQPV
jgi:Na+/proline symporter